jgi:hypothetical protein
VTQIRQSILLILTIVAIGLAAVLVILAPHDQALAQPGYEAHGMHLAVISGDEPA